MVKNDLFIYKYTWKSYIEHDLEERIAKLLI